MSDQLHTWSFKTGNHSKHCSEIELTTNKQEIIDNTALKCIVSNL